MSLEMWVLIAVLLIPLLIAGAIGEQRYYTWLRKKQKEEIDRRERD